MRRFSQLNFGRRPSQPEPSHDPVLTAEDEAFLQRVTSQPDSGAPAPIPDDDTPSVQGKPPPPSPATDERNLNQENTKPTGKLQKSATVPEMTTGGVTGKEKKRRPWSRIWRRTSVMKVCTSVENLVVTSVTLTPIGW